MATLLLGTPARPAAKPLKVPPREAARTASGLEVIVAHRGPLPLVALRLVVRAGSAADPAGKQGLADFTARLLRRGTKTLSAEAIDEAVEFVGGSLATAAYEDYLVVSISAPAEHLRAMLGVMGQLVREPTFPEAEVESAKKRVLGQIANELDDPSSLADRAFVGSFWGGHPYGHEVSGRAADVRSFTRDDLASFHREKVGPRVATLLIVGDVEPKEAFAAAQEAFAGWGAGPPSAFALPNLVRPPGEGQVVLVDKPDQTQTQVRIGARGVARGDPDYFPIIAFNTTLGGSFTSRLVREVRVKRGLSYGVDSHFDALAAGGSFVVSTFTQTDKTREVLDVALAQLAKMRERGPTAAELATAKSFVSALYPSRIETNEGVAQALADISLYGLPADFVETFREKLGAVSRAQAADAAARHLEIDRPLIVLVGAADKIRPLVEGLGTVTVKKAADLRVTKLAVLFRGEGYAAVDKPPGTLVIPGRGADEGPSLRALAEEALGHKVFVVHRLDRDTSGLLLFALDAKTHRTLSMAFEAGLVEKRYLALVEGSLAAPLELTRALVPARRGRMRLARPGEQGKDAHTLVRPIEALSRATLVEATPLTGRTHQIRVHLADAGHPLLLDHQYGRGEPWTGRALGGDDDAVVLARTPLHAARLTLPALEGITARALESSLPPDMGRALELLRGGVSPR